MKVEIESEHLNGLVVLSHKDVFEDERGFFMEVFRHDVFERLGLPTRFVQDNHSRSKKGVIRGLHFQWNPQMGKLMRVTVGSAYLVAVDIRKRSPSVARWFGIEVSARNKKQVYAPAGFARGFCVLSEYAEVQYKATAIYNGNGESGILWNDAALGIEWPIKYPLVSEKDRNAKTLAEWLATPESDHLQF